MEHVQNWVHVKECLEYLCVFNIVYCIIFSDNYPEMYLRANEIKEKYRISTSHQCERLEMFFC